MSSIVPVPLLSLYTAKMVETAVCGYEEVDIHMLKKVVRCVCARCASDFIENKTKLDSTFLSFLSTFLFHPPPLTLSSLPPPPLPLYPDIETVSVRVLNWYNGYGRHLTSSPMKRRFFSWGLSLDVLASPPVSVRYPNSSRSQRVRWDKQGFHAKYIPWWEKGDFHRQESIIQLVFDLRLLLLVNESSVDHLVL